MRVLAFLVLACIASLSSAKFAENAGSMVASRDSESPSVLLEENQVSIQQQRKDLKDQVEKLFKQSMAKRREADAARGLASKLAELDKSLEEAAHVKAGQPGIKPLGGLFKSPFPSLSSLFGWQQKQTPETPVMLPADPTVHIHVYKVEQPQPSGVTVQHVLAPASVTVLPSQ